MCQIYFDHKMTTRQPIWVGLEDQETSASYVERFRKKAALCVDDERMGLEVASANEQFRAYVTTPLVGTFGHTISSFYLGMVHECHVVKLLPSIVKRCPDFCMLNADFGNGVFVEFHMRPRGGRLSISAKFADGGRIPDAFANALTEYDLLSKVVFKLCVFTEIPKRDQLTSFPTSLAKLTFTSSVLCGLEWEFLVESNVQALTFRDCALDDAIPLGLALAAYVTRKVLSKLSISECSFADVMLITAGDALSRVVHLELCERDLNGVSVKCLSKALCVPGCAIRHLTLPYTASTAQAIDDYLVPVLKRPECTLKALYPYCYETVYQARMCTLKWSFAKWQRVFILLQGQQVRRFHSPLRRLPVEMFRVLATFMK